MRYFRRICRVDKLEYEEQQSPTAQDPTLQDSIAPDPIAPDQDPIPQGTHRIEFFGAAQDDADKPAPDGTHRIEFFGAVQADDLGAITQGTHRIEFFGASQDAIAHHYDVGNDFYAMWLDPTMTYSCALWDDAADLHAAQLAKIDYHIAQARAHGADRVLDIGCGWGPTLHRLVSVGGVRNAVGLTLSKEQAAY